jgi:hypothetical protein
MPIVDIQPTGIASPVDTPKGFTVTPGQDDIDHGSEKPEGSVLGAAFRQGNMVVDAFNLEETPSYDEPDFKAWDSIKGTKYEPRWSSFVDVRNTKALDVVKRRIDQEVDDKRLLDSAPWYQSVPAQLAAGVLDLPTLMPGGTFIRGVRGGFSIAKSAASVAAAGGASTTIQEAGLQSMQETRSAVESGVNIGASVLLGGLLGAGGAKLLSGVEWSNAVAAIERELIAWHGSPHSFTAFDLSKIGTGEGAQAYGHGLYFAENPKVAESYQWELARVAGETYGWKTHGRSEYSKLLINKSAGDIDQAIDEVRGKTGLASRLRAIPEGTLEELEAIKSEGRGTPAGSMYKVRLSADPDRLLDWDKPLSEQSDAVRAAFNSIDHPMFEAWKKSGAWDHVKGETLYREMAGGLTNKAHAEGRHVIASQRLRDAGLHGIKYLDQYSRGADAASKTRNLVIFDDKLVSITDRSGAPVADGGGAPTSAGAAANLPMELEANAIAGKAAGAIAASTARLNPALRLLQSPSAATREISTQLFENSLYLKKNLDGVASEPAVETLMKEWNGGLARAVTSTDEAFSEYSKAGGPLSRHQFREAVGKAMRRGDEDNDPFVSKVAREWRAKVFEPLKQKAIEDKLLPEDVDVETAISYLSRMWNRNKLIAQEGRFKEIVRKWVEDNSPKWAEGFDKNTERSLDPLHREIQELEVAKLRRSEELNQRSQAGEADTSEIGEADIRSALRIVQGGAPRPKGVETLTQFVAKAGGLVDFGGELAYRGINNKARPGFIRSERKRAQGTGGGWSLDDMARHAWESGYFPGHDSRPSIEDFLNALQDDFFKTRAVVKAGDRDAFRLNELIDQLDQDLARAGVTDVKGTRFSTSDELKGMVRRVYSALDAEADRKINALKAKLSEREATSRVEREARFMGNPQELGRGIADEVFNRLTGKTVDLGIRPEFLVVKARGPLKERTFNIPDELVEDFLEHDVELVGRRYTRIMGADVELAHKFGSVDLVEQMQKIRDDYQRLRSSSEGKNAKALDRAEETDISDLESLRDLLRGQTIYNHGIEQKFNRIVRGANHVNYIRSMGEVVLASLTDAIRPAMVHGLGRFMATVPQLASNMRGIKLSVGEARLAGNVSERILGHRLATISEIIDPYSSRGPVEKFLENMTNVASKWNGIRIWTDMAKSLTSVMTQNRILEGVTSFAKTKDKSYLAYLGIDESMAGRIAKQFETHGETVDGVRVANTEEWTDQVAVRTYRAAMNKDVDSIIVQKGVADVPLFANTPTGKALLQFKSFALASHQKILLRGLQEDQSRFLGGLVAMTAMGMFVTYLKAVSGNRPETREKALSNPGWWIGEGLDRSGVLSVPMELANTLEKFSGGFNPLKAPFKAFDETGSISQKNQNRSDVGSLLGPTIGMASDMMQVGSIPRRMAQGEEVTKGQMSAAERLLPFNSYNGIRQFIRYVANPPE